MTKPAFSRRLSKSWWALFPLLAILHLFLKMYVLRYRGDGWFLLDTPYRSLYGLGYQRTRFILVLTLIIFILSYYWLVAALIAAIKNKAALPKSVWIKIGLAIVFLVYLNKTVVTYFQIWT